MKRFTISASSTYDVITGYDTIKDIGKYTGEVLDPCRLCIITDSTVNSLYSQVVLTSLIESGFQTSKIVFPSGEHSKNLSTYTNILEALADEGITRSDAVVALGGGAVGDIAGFAAATYMRGIRYIQIPTTYEAAVDAAYGGETGLNLMSGKNLVGAFWQPSLVLCDYKFFETLSDLKIKDGAAEAVKFAVISESSLADHILKNDYEYVVERCISIKKSLIEADEKCYGLRQILGFGHTVGQAVEKLSSYSLPHGHAVAIGMVIESKAAFKAGLTKTDISVELTDIFKRLGFDTSCHYSADEIYNLAVMDKKIFGDKISVIVPEKFGKCSLHKISISNLREYIREGLK